ncbi:MAG: DegT/DnrJ/EryC1/StrS family aminotransferase [Clostridia bacterium]|nr:DegT/DnrJ/EryC1/StrS family aminotransferase [Clostridia bacterium]
MSNNKIYVTRSSMPDMSEYVEEIASIFQSHLLTNMGPKHDELASNLTDYLEVEHISLFSNGHMALELCLQALSLQGEVITTPFTFASTTHAIVRSGLTPVFCDIDPDTYTIDVNKIEALITDKTCAIVPVHVYGNLCDTEAIDKIAKKYNLKVIYDAAHAFGVKRNGVGAGSFGDASMFSFHATKVFNTVEGGAVCYSNPAIGDKLHCLRNFGILDQETVSDVGANAKMNEFQAAMGLCNLRHIEEEIAKRKAVCDRYRKHLENKEGIKLCTIPSDVTHNYAYFPVVFDETKLGKTRNDIFTSLAKENIFARKYFYPLVQDYDCYKDRYSSDSTPTAKYIANRVLTLPLYADLPLEEVDRICRIILQA